MDLNSVLDSFVKSELQKFLISKNIIDTGDQLNGRVIQVRPDNKVLLDLGGFRALAEVNFDVQKGDLIPLKVVANDDIIRLIVNRESSSQSADISKPELIEKFELVFNKNHENLSLYLKKFFGDSLNRILPDTGSVNSDSSFFVKDQQINSESLNNVRSAESLTSDLSMNIKEVIKEAVNSVLQNLEPLDPDLPVFKIAERVQKAVKDSGVFFENKLSEAIIETISQDAGPLTESQKSAVKNSHEIREIIQNDLKPNLLLIKKFLSESSDKDVKTESMKLHESIEKGVENLLTGIQLSKRQGIKAKSTESSQQNMDVFFFNIPLKDEKKCSLKVYTRSERDKKGGKSGIRLSLLLTMERLGLIRTDFFYLNRNLNITIFVTSKEIRDFLTHNIKDLQQGINGIFRESIINILVSEKKIKDFETEDIDTNITVKRIVDIKA